MAWTAEERREYFRRRYHERRLWAIDYLGGVCVDCGEDDPNELGFDHADPNVKPLIQVSNVIRAWSITRLKKMMRQQKIELRCDNCREMKSRKERELVG